MRFKTPESVAREIISFDRHADFAPGRYTLNAPGTSDSLEGKHKDYQDRKKRKKRKVDPAEKQAANAEYRAEVPSGTTAGYKNHRTAGVRSLRD